MQFKKQIVILFGFFVLFPTTMQFFHAIDHEHHSCNSNNIVHFHEINLECGVFHQQINHNSIDFSSDAVFEKSFYSSDYPILECNNSKNLTFLNTAQRGPPFLLFV